MQKRSPGPGANGSNAAKTRNRSKLNFFLDLGLAIFFAAEMEVHFTGLLLHEWLGLFFAALLALHVVLHWNWVVSITQTFFRKLIHEARLNYVLNAALFVDVVVVSLTGIAVSETLGLNFGLRGAALIDWQSIHALSSHLCLVLTAAHVALHWKWIAAHAGKYLFAAKAPGNAASGQSETTQ